MAVPSYPRVLDITSIMGVGVRGESTGAALDDPSGLFNSSLDGNTRRAIDFHEGDTIDAKALQALVRPVALNRS